jgi:hypothetical protein
MVNLLFDIPVKMVIETRKRPGAPGLARRSRGGAEPPAVGRPFVIIT